MAKTVKVTGKAAKATTIRAKGAKGGTKIRSYKSLTGQTIGRSGAGGGGTGG